MKILWWFTNLGPNLLYVKLPSKVTNMELFTQPRLSSTPARQPSGPPTSVDFVIKDGGLVAVVELVGTFQQARFADVTVSMSQPDGDVVLVGTMQFAVPTKETAIAALLRDLWLPLRSAMMLAPSELRLKAADRGLGQDRLSRVASAHLYFQHWDRDGDRGVLPKTARMWRFLTDLGSSRPAELIADALDEKVSTIHARINLSRDQGLIPPPERSRPTRNSSRKSRNQ